MTKEQFDVQQTIKSRLLWLRAQGKAGPWSEPWDWYVINKEPADIVWACCTDLIHAVSGLRETSACFVYYATPKEVVDLIEEKHPDLRVWLGARHLCTYRPHNG